MSRIVWFLLGFVLLLGACDNDDKDVLSEGKMADLLADLSIADQLVRNSSDPDAPFHNDSVVKVLRQSIFKKNDVTEAQFDSTLNYYGHNLEAYSKLYKKVEQRLQSRYEKLNHAPALLGNGNENNLWPLSPMIMVSPRDAFHGFSFSVPAEKLSSGSVMTWRMRTSDFPEATIFLGVEYADLSLDYVRQGIRGSGSHQLEIAVKPDDMPRRVIGYLHFGSIPDTEVFIDSLTLTKRQSADLPPMSRIGAPRRPVPTQTPVPERQIPESRVGDTLR